VTREGGPEAPAPLAHGGLIARRAHVEWRPERAHGLAGESKGAQAPGRFGPPCRLSRLPTSSTSPPAPTAPSTSARHPTLWSANASTTKVVDRDAPLRVETVPSGLTAASWMTVAGNAAVWPAGVKPTRHASISTTRGCVAGNSAFLSCSCLEALTRIVRFQRFQRDADRSLHPLHLNELQESRSSAESQALPPAPLTAGGRSIRWFRWNAPRAVGLMPGAALRLTAVVGGGAESGAARLWHTDADA